VTPAAKKSRKASPARAKTAVERFWVRQPNPELDRTGDFILKNLASIRKEAASRGSAD
jgi:hypothetical protein